MPTLPTVHELRARALFLSMAWAALILCFILVQPAQFTNPFTWGDDIVWEIGSASYGIKLREEGRWLNYAWILAFGHGSAAFDHNLIIALWCGTALTIAGAAAGTRRPTVLLLAAALAISPSAWALTLWPHTVLPTVAILTIGGAGVFLAPDDKGRLRALFLAMIATMLSYQLFSFYLLGALLTILVLGQAQSGEPLPIRRFAPRLGVLVGVGAAGMVAGVVVQFGLNAIAFGHFGLEQAAWRAVEADALRAGSRPELAWVNLRLNLSYLNDHMMGRLALVAWTAAAALGASVAGSDAEGRRRLCLYAAVLAATAAAPLAIPFATGMLLPADRGSLNLWLGLVGVLALPIVAPVGVVARRIAVAGIALLIVSSVQALSLFSTAFEQYREQNAIVLNQLTAQLRANGGSAAPNGSAIHFIGRTEAFEGPAGDEHWFGATLIQHKLKNGKQELVFCVRVEGCPGLAGPRARFAAMPSFPASGSMVASGNGIVVKLGGLAVEPPAYR